MGMVRSANKKNITMQVGTAVFVAGKGCEMTRVIVPFSAVYEVVPGMLFKVLKKKKTGIFKCFTALQLIAGGLIFGVGRRRERFLY